MRRPRARSITVASFLLAVAFVVGFRLLRPVHEELPQASAGLVAGDSRMYSGKSEKKPASAAPPSVAKPKLIHSPPDAVPEGNYAELLPILMQRADKGDAVASYQIFSMLEDCKRMFRGYDDDNTNKKRLSKCDGISQGDLDAAVKWLQVAADAGSAEAMAAYPIYAGMDINVTAALRDPQSLQDYKDRSRRYLETLAADGSPAAMHNLASAYFDGLLPQNPQLAFAYDYASHICLNGRLDVNVSDFPFTAYSSRLTEDQIEAAKQMGRKMHARYCQ